MKKLGLLLTLFAFHTPAQAALSAFSQGVKEIKELLAAPFIKEQLSQRHPIQEIRLVDQDEDSRVYLVGTNEKTILAKFRYLPSPKLLGPRPYEIEWEIVEN